VDVVLDAAPDVFAHNLEVTRRLTRLIRDQRCSYDQSLAVLAHARRAMPAGFVKSSLMVGIGETDDEVIDTLGDLRKAGVDVVTIGQYLRPTPKHADVKRYVQPEIFAEYERRAYELGFAYVASGPLVRSSYHAAEAFIAAKLRSGPQESPESTNSTDRSGPPHPAIEPAEPKNQLRNSLIPPSALVRRSS